MSVNDSVLDNIETNSTFKNVIKIKYVISVVIIFITFIVANAVSFKIQTNNKNNKIVINTLSTLVYYFIILIGILISILNAGFQVGSIIVLLSSFGLAAALGLQKLITQMGSGLLIVFNNMYKINDYIITNGKEGIVTKFGLFNTTITNNDNIPTIIPNDAIVNSNITNISHEDNIRIRVYFTIKNQDNFDLNQFINLIKKTTLLSKYVIDKNVIVSVSDISHIYGTKIIVIAKVKGKNYNKSRANIKYLILRVLSNTKLLNSPVNISLNEQK